MGKKRNKSIACLNCDFVFKETNNYCPNCGQENHDLKVPFTHIISEVIESTIHFDEKVISTLKTIFTKPGQISIDFNEGKRARYVPPVRLYIFVSFIFFLILGKITYQSGKDENLNKEVTYTYAIEKNDSIISPTSTGESPLTKDLKTVFENEELTDSILIKNNIEVTNFNRKCILKFAEIVNGGLNEFLNHLIKYFSLSLFLLMPAFALILKLLYRKSNKYYYEHLIFTIHLHVIALVLCSLMLLSLLTKLDEYIIPILMLGLIMYEFLSLLKFYGQNKRKTLIKIVLINSLYMLLNFATIIAVFFIAILL